MGGTHKGNRQLSSPKREKREADKRKSVNSLKDMLRSWQPAAALDEFDCDTSFILPARKADGLPASSLNEEAREDENPDVDIELQKEIRAMEKRLELKLKVFLKDAVGEATKLLEAEAREREQEERAGTLNTIRTMMRNESQEILSKVASALEVSVSK